MHVFLIFLKQNSSPVYRASHFFNIYKSLLTSRLYISRPIPSCRRTQLRDQGNEWSKQASIQQGPWLPLHILCWPSTATVANQEEDYSGSTPILFIKLLVIGEKGLGFLMMGRKGVSIVFFFFPLSCDYSYIVLCRYLICYMDCFVNISYLIMIHFEFLLLFIDCFAFYCLWVWFFSLRFSGKHFDTPRF